MSRMKSASSGLTWRSENAEKLSFRSDSNACELVKPVWTLEAPDKPEPLFARLVELAYQRWFGWGWKPPGPCRP